MLLVENSRIIIHSTGQILAGLSSCLASIANAHLPFNRGVEAVEFLQKVHFPYISDYFHIVRFSTLNWHVCCDLIDIIPLEIKLHGQLQA
jgi:hypothetical protein